MQVRNMQGIFCLPITVNNVHSVTSNAVYKAVVTDKKFYYDSNADRTNVSVRANAIKTLLNGDYNNKNVGGVGTIRYTGGYYYTYVWGYRATVGEHSVLEINPYGGGELNIWSLNNDNYALVRTI